MISSIGRKLRHRGARLSILWIPKRWDRLSKDPSLLYATSNRIRAYLPHSVISREMGILSHVAGVDDVRLQPFRYDAAIYQKIYPGRMGSLLRKLGTLVVWDICDEVEIPSGIDRNVDIVTTSSQELAQACRPAIPGHVAVEVLDDPQESNPTWDRTRLPGARTRATWYGTGASAHQCVPFLDSICQGVDGVDFIFSTNDIPPWNEMNGFAPGVDYHHNPSCAPADSWQRFVSETEVGLVPVLGKISSAHKALNYMAYGIPVVCTPTPNHRRVIDHGVHGFFAEAPSDWTDRLRDLRDPSLRQRIGQAGKTVAERHTVGQMGMRFIDLIEAHVRARSR